MITAGGTPNCRSMRASSAAWVAISLRARLMRAGMTRVDAYSSKLLAWNMPRWRRSNASTAGLGVMPAKAWSMVARATPAACASRAIAAMKALKSPPQWAAGADVANKSERTNAASGRLTMTISYPGTSAVCANGSGA